MDNIYKHHHNGTDAAQVYAEDLLGRSLITADFQLSARQGQPSIVQRGSYTMANGVKFVTFPQAYTQTNTLQILVTPKQNSLNYLQGIVVSGFTVSGSGADTGSWLSIGYE